MKTKEEAKKEILDLVAEYARNYHKPDSGFKEGDRIPYASRVYDENEMVNLVDSSLEFWLTSGRYTEEFEKRFAEFLGIKYCSLVNSGSSANLIAFMALTSPLLGLLCMLMLMIGYSTYALIVIRSSANPPMDQNSPEV